jgi:Flp pilus assembly protein TadD
VENEINGNIEEAFKNFDLAVKNDPSNPLFLTNRGDALMKLGRQ